MFLSLDLQCRDNAFEIELDVLGLERAGESRFRCLSCLAALLLLHTGSGVCCANLPSLCVLRFYVTNALNICRTGTLHHLAKYCKPQVIATEHLQAA